MSNLFEYGNNPSKKKEPSDGSFVNINKYLRKLPNNIKKKIIAYSPIGCYYSVPSKPLSKFMDFVFNKFIENKKEIERYKSFWSNDLIINTFDSIQFIYASQIQDNRKTAYIACFTHEIFANGTVIIIGANMDETVKYQKFTKDMVNKAILYWSEVMKNGKSR